MTIFKEPEHIVFVDNGVAHPVSYSEDLLILDLDVLEQGDCPICGNRYGELQIDDYTCVQCGIDWSEGYTVLGEQVRTYARKQQGDMT